MDIVRAENGSNGALEKSNRYFIFLENNSSRLFTNLYIFDGFFQVLNRLWEGKDAAELKWVLEEIPFSNMDLDNP